jgi:hypothetical protein
MYSSKWKIRHRTRENKTLLLTKKIKHSRSETVWADTNWFWQMSEYVKVYIKNDLTGRHWSWRRSNRNVVQTNCFRTKRFRTNGFRTNGLRTIKFRFLTQNLYKTVKKWFSNKIRKKVFEQSRFVEKAFEQTTFEENVFEPTLFNKRFSN